MVKQRFARGMGASAAALTLLLLAACATDGTTNNETASSDTFAFGTLLPMTGAAAQFGPAMSGAVALAAEDINAAGGILGATAEIISADDAGDPSIASQGLDRLLNSGANAIMGTGSSSVTLSLLDKVKSAHVSMCSGANTAPDLSDYPDDGYFFRTSYSNALQGPVLAQLALRAGNTSVALVGRGDAFGEGLVNAAEESLIESGADVVKKIIYDPAQTTFDAEVGELAAANPEAVIVVGYDERGKMFRSMIERGIGPKSIDVFTTGVLSEEFWQLVDPGDPTVIEGIEQSAPPLAGNEAFAARLTEHDSAITSVQFAAEQYDCAIITALAAVSAGSIEASDYREHIADVTRGDVECSDYAECVSALEAGDSIAYSGLAGSLRFSDIGEPTRATFQIYSVDATGKSVPTDRIEVQK